jgi:hypothetical protein
MYTSPSPQKKGKARMEEEMPDRGDDDTASSLNRSRTRKRGFLAQASKHMQSTNR